MRFAILGRSEILLDAARRLREGAMTSVLSALATAKNSIPPMNPISKPSPANRTPTAACSRLCRGK